MRIKLEEIYTDYFLLDAELFVLKYGRDKYEWLNKAVYLFEIKEELGMTKARINSLLQTTTNTLNTHYALYFKLKEELKDKIAEKELSESN